MLRAIVAPDAEGGCPAAPVPDYADENISTRVVEIVQPHTGIVYCVAWRRR